MDKQRRNFIKNSSLLTGGLVFLDPFQQLSARLPMLSRALYTIDIFHSNDLHNQLQAFSGEYEGYGGLENVTHVLESSGKDSLLLDAGDFLDDQSSPAEHWKMVRSMNRAGYHAATLGNREMALGCDYLSSLCRHMNFKLVNCNYAISHPELKQQVQPFLKLNWGRYRIAILGIGTELPADLKNKEGITVNHPYEAANETARRLRAESDLVICLSHLGYDTNGKGYDNTAFAALSENIDLIISGHRDNLVSSLKVLKNKKGEEVFLSHGGWGGLIVRHISFSFDNFGRRHSLSCRNYVPSAEAAEPFYKGLNKIMA
jgi:5'-nucleotidase